MLPPKFSHDPEQHVFIVELDGHQGTVLYQDVPPDVLDFQSTYIPHVLRNRHVGSQLVRYALDYARQHGKRVIPSCWFVRQVAEQMPGYRELLTDPAH